MSNRSLHDAELLLDPCHLLTFMERVNYVHLREAQHRGTAPLWRICSALVQQPPEHALAIRSYVCPDCERSFGTYNQLRSHQRHSFCSWSKETLDFQGALDCEFELPICRWCRKEFKWWGALKKHISEGHCEALHLRPRAPNPIVQTFHVHLDLLHHCVVCARWFPLARSLSKHLRSAHQQDFHRAKEAYESSSFKGMRFKDICPYCKSHHGPARLLPHIKHHCVVLLQRFLARIENPLDVNNVRGEQASPLGQDNGCEQEAGCKEPLCSNRYTATRCLGSSNTTQCQEAQVSRQQSLSSIGCKGLTRRCRSGSRCGDEANIWQEQQEQQEQPDTQRKSPTRRRRRYKSSPGHASSTTLTLGPCTTRAAPMYDEILCGGLPPRTLRTAQRGPNFDGVQSRLEIDLRRSSRKDQPAAPCRSLEEHLRDALPSHRRHGDHHGPEPVGEVPGQGSLLRARLGQCRGQTDQEGGRTQTFTHTSTSTNGGAEHAVPFGRSRETQGPQASTEASLRRRPYQYC